MSVEGRGKTGVRVNVEGQNGAATVDGTRLLVAAGRSANVNGLDLEKARIAYDRRGIKTGPNLKSSNRRVYAIGDVIGGPLLAHKAEDEGVACVEQIATGYGHVNYNAIPSVIYTSPEVAWVGSTEEGTWFVYLCIFLQHLHR